MKKLLAGTILFGSIWGLLECSLGDWLHGYGLSAIMASIAVFLMAVTRHIYRAPGMQASMALIASLLRHFNPMGTCLVCASIAIFIEGLAFEIIWLLPWRKYQSYTMKVSMGVISFYSIYAIGYLSTQILTPLLTSKFYFGNLIGVIPKILAGATIAGIIGGFALPVTYLPLKIKIKDKFYYPITAVVTLFCWIAVILGV
ncbi:MAG TPA: hypothetical protein ENI33_02610 [Thermoplasmatales archaeon]|nr:hypothetical protein [Thermoplasmatales archaeon]